MWGRQITRVFDLKRAELIEVPSKPTPQYDGTMQIEELLLVPLWFAVIAWGIVLLMQLHFWKSVHRKTDKIKCIDKIPCANCKFFDNNPYIKCAIHPSKALSEEAIDCSDHSPKALNRHQ